MESIFLPIWLSCLTLLAVIMSLTFSVGFTCLATDTRMGAARHSRISKRLLPATHIVISPNAILEQKRYWRLEYTPAAGLDPVSYSQEVFEAFKKGATLRSRVVVGEWWRLAVAWIAGLLLPRFRTMWSFLHLHLSIPVMSYYHPRIPKLPQRSPVT